MPKTAGKETHAKDSRERDTCQRQQGKRHMPKTARKETHAKDSRERDTCQRQLGKRHTHQRQQGKRHMPKQKTLSEETLKLLKKRRELKQEKGNQRIEYAETCKTIRKRMKDEIRQYNMNKIEQTIQEDRSLKKLNDNLYLENHK